METYCQSFPETDIFRQWQCIDCVEKCADFRGDRSVENHEDAFGGPSLCLQALQGESKVARLRFCVHGHEYCDFAYAQWLDLLFLIQS